MKNTFSIVFLFTCLFSFGEQKQIDSLSFINRRLPLIYSLLKSIYLWLVFSLIFLSCQPTSKKPIPINDKELFSKYSAAVDSLNKNSPFALKLLRELKETTASRNDTTNASITLLLGKFYLKNNSYPQALSMYQDALLYFDKIKDEKKLAFVFHQIGQLHYFEGDEPVAISYYKKSIALARKINNKRSEARGLFSIGTTYWDLSINKANKLFSDSAITALLQAENIYKTLKDSVSLAGTYTELGEAYKYSGDRINCLKNFLIGYNLYKIIKNWRGVAVAGTKIAMHLMQDKKMEDAKKYIDEALLLIEKTDDTRWKSICYQIAAGVYSDPKIKNLPFDYYTKHIEYRDKIYSNDKLREFTQKEIEFNFEKEKILTEAKYSANISQEKSRGYWLLFALSLVIIFSIFIYSRFKIIKRQNKIIEKQKLLVEQKQKEILDSIHYAKRIQTALLPGITYVTKNLNRLRKL